MPESGDFDLPRARCSLLPSTAEKPAAYSGQERMSRSSLCRQSSNTLGEASRLNADHRRDLGTNEKTKATINPEFGLLHSPDDHPTWFADFERFNPHLFDCGDDVRMICFSPMLQ